MKELQESLLAITLEKLAESLHQVAEGIKAQNEAINRLAESNESLTAIICQSVMEDFDPDIPSTNYLSGSPRG